MTTPLKKLLKIIILKSITIILILHCAVAEKHHSSPTAAADDFYKKQDESDVKKSGKLTTWKKGNQIPNTPKLFVGDKEDLPLLGEEIHVQVDGFRARVLVDCYYTNNKGRVLEGDFKLQLPFEASPYYFAFGETVFLDESKKIPFISQKESSQKQISFSREEITKLRRNSSQSLKEARVVPKEKAIQAYEDTVRKNVDPAILEWSGADIFSGRVFPLSPNKVHRITIGYDVNLTPIGNDLEYSLGIPEKKSPTIVSIQASKIGKSLPLLNSGLKWKENGKDLSLYLENSSSDEIKIRYPNLSTTVLYEIKDESYFATRFKLNLNKKEETNSKAYAVFALDISKSSNPNHFTIWIELMQEILKKNRNTMPRFAVMFFNIETHWWKEEFIANTPDNLDKLKSYVNELALVGATDLQSAVYEAANVSWSKEKNVPKNVFLLSDGSATWGETNLYVLKSKLPADTKIYAYKTGLSGSDSRALEFITKASGGNLYSVTGESEITKASVAHLNRSYQLKSVKVEGISDILVSGSPTYVYDGQELILAGRGLAEKATKIEIELGEREKTTRIQIPIVNKVESNLTSRVYGQLATAQLEDLSFLTEESSKKYAMYYSVAGQTCSFLMLESEADYERYSLKKEDLKTFISKNTVQSILNSVYKQINQTLLSQKSAFLNWLSQLKQVPGIKFDPQNIEGLASDLNEESFNLEKEKFITTIRKKEEFNSAVLDELNKTELTYSLFQSQSMQLSEKDKKADGLKVFSTLVEAKPGDGILARDISYYALNWNYPLQAYYLLKRVLTSKPYEPQTYHLIAQALAKSKKYDLAILFYEIAFTTIWDAKFGDFNEIVGIDYSFFIRSILKTKENFLLENYAKKRLTEISKGNNSGLMVAISWNTDRTDIDLHVIEPNGEECFYSNKDTRSGGSLTKDVTQGYGPELYVHSKPPKGKYRITAHYFASDQLKTSVSTKVKVSIYLNRGLPDESVIEKVISLETGKSVHEIETVEIK